jgi:hypothetical protein
VEEKGNEKGMKRGRNETEKGLRKVGVREIR